MWLKLQMRSEKVFFSVAEGKTGKCLRKINWLPHLVFIWDNLENWISEFSVMTNNQFSLVCSRHMRFSMVHFFLRHKALISLVCMNGRQKKELQSSWFLKNEDEHGMGELFNFIKSHIRGDFNYENSKNSFLLVLLLALSLLYFFIQTTIPPNNVAILFSALYATECFWFMLKDCSWNFKALSFTFIHYIVL